MNNLLNGIKQLSIRSSSAIALQSQQIKFQINQDLLLVQPATCQLEQQRTRFSVVQRNMGKPRPPDPFKPQADPHKYAYIPQLPQDGIYTAKLLKIQKLGGRCPETGRVVVGTIGGGNKKYFRWIDFHRNAPENGKIEEKVYSVRYDPLNSYLIALVAREGHKRWIVASEYMKPGDVITTHNFIPKIPIVGKEGDTYPVGALVPGSVVHHVELIPGQGATRCLAAGSHATVLRRAKDKVIILLPSKQEVGVDEHCYVTCGKTSNTNHYTVNLLCPQRLRWKGKRSKSGLWKKKDGYCGFKNRPPKSLKIFDTTLPEETHQVIQPIFNLSN